MDNTKYDNTHAHAYIHTHTHTNVVGLSQNMYTGRCTAHNCKQEKKITS